MATAQIWLVRRGSTSWGKTTGTLLEVAALAFAATLMAHAEPWADHASSIRFIGSAGSSWLRSGGIACVGFALLIYLMASERGVISRVLAARPLVLLGEISFSIYLVHAPLLWAMERFANRFRDVPTSLQALGYGATLLLVSYVIWSGIEMPCRRLIVQAVLRKRKRSSSAITPPSFLEGSRRGLIAASLLLALVAIPICRLANTPQRPRFITPEAARETIKSTPTHLRDIHFGNKFLLCAATTIISEDAVELHLIWTGIGRQKLEYNVLVQMIDADGKVLWRTAFPQSETAVKTDAGQTWENVISIPKKRGPVATHLAIILENPDQKKRLAPDRGPVDSVKRRLLIPISDADL